jgi:hypothetical protein
VVVTAAAKVAGANTSLSWAAKYETASARDVKDAMLVSEAAVEDTVLAIEVSDLRA